MRLEIRGISPETARSRVLRASKVRDAVDLTGEPDIYPISIACETYGQSALIRVPIEKCRHLLWLAFPCGRDSLSPYIRTIRDYQQKRCRTYRGSALEAFYRAFLPASAADLLGLENLACPVLHATPPAGAPVPWTPGDLQHKASHRAMLMTEENRFHGEPLEYTAGDKFFGPVSTRKGELEFRRLIEVYEQIKQAGFKVFEDREDNIQVSFLLSDEDDDWRCRIFTGQHRVAALSALGYESVIVSLREEEALGGVIQRKDARYWPTVRQNYLTPTEATALFDRMFHGRQPPQLRFANGRAVAAAGVDSTRHVPA